MARDFDDYLAPNERCHAISDCCQHAANFRSKRVYTAEIILKL